jgi:hypothetical protein
LKAWRTRETLALRRGFKSAAAFPKRARRFLKSAAAVSKKSAAFIKSAADSKKRRGNLCKERGGPYKAPDSFTIKRCGFSKERSAGS